MDMFKRGLNLCKYAMEKNQELHQRVNIMVHNDVICQWLMGDKLKRDQFQFIYDTIEVIYNSPCREALLKFFVEEPTVEIQWDEGEGEGEDEDEEPAEGEGEEKKKQKMPQVEKPKVPKET